MTQTELPSVPVDQIKTCCEDDRDPDINYDPQIITIELM